MTTLLVTLCALVLVLVAVVKWTEEPRQSGAEVVVAESSPRVVRAMAKSDEGPPLTALLDGRPEVLEHAAGRGLETPRGIWLPIARDAASEPTSTRLRFAQLPAGVESVAEPPELLALPSPLATESMPPPELPAKKDLMPRPIRKRVVTAEAIDFAPILVFQDVHPGESPMLRNWKMMTMAAALSAALSTPPVVLAQATQSDSKKMLDRFDRLEKMISQMKATLMSSLKSVRADVGGVQAKMGGLEKEVTQLQKESAAQQKQLGSVGESVQELDKAVKGLASRFDDLEGTVTSVNKTVTGVSKTVDGVNKSVDSLKGDVVSQRVELGKVTAKVDSLEKTVAKLKTNIDALRKRDLALYPPSDKSGIDDIKKKLTRIESTLAEMQKVKESTPMAAEVADARIVLDNRYDEYLLLVVEGESYRVNPGTALPVSDLPPGTYTYEVISPTWGLRVRNTITLAGGETFRLTATNPS